MNKMDYYERERQRQEWLSTLKVGDEVFVEAYGRKQVATVTNITTKRRDITVKYHPENDGIIFASDGREKKEYGEKGWLYPYNEQTIAEENLRVTRRRNRYQIDRIKWREVSDEKVAQILAILNEGKENG